MLSYRYHDPRMHSEGVSHLVVADTICRFHLGTDGYKQTYHNIWRRVCMGLGISSSLLPKCLLSDSRLSLPLLSGLRLMA